MLIGNEFVRRKEQTLVRDGRVGLKPKDGSSVTILVPTLFEMSKAIMKMRCNLKADADEIILEEFSKLEYAMMKMTVDIEYLRGKGQ